jgi:hypothetical protein
MQAGWVYLREFLEVLAAFQKGCWIGATFVLSGSRGDAKNNQSSATKEA